MYAVQILDTAHVTEPAINVKNCETVYIHFHFVTEIKCIPACLQNPRPVKELHTQNQVLY
jgi:hypothetical protein